MQTTHLPIDSLEIVGVGASVETWNNHPDYPELNLWNAVKECAGSYIVSQDPTQYPQNINESQALSGKRKQNAVEIAMRHFMDRYPLPIAVVGPGLHGPVDDNILRRETNAETFVVTEDAVPYTSRGKFSGLPHQCGQVMNSYLNDNPDQLWNTIFSTFDEYADIPAVGVAAKDGVMQRAIDFYNADHSEFYALAEQIFHPKQARILSDNWTFLTLLRHGRIDWLRPYAPLMQDTMKMENPDGEVDVRHYSEFAGWSQAPPQPFVPTPFISAPWTPFQITQYDHQKSVATLYRPQVVSYINEDGKPVKAAERQTRLETALRGALAPLGGKLPERIFYDYGSILNDRTSATRFLPLVQSLQAIDEEFSLLDPEHGFDLGRILGDTGAGSPFVAVALAAMAAKQSGGATLVANLRRNDGATLLLVTPPASNNG